MVTRVHGELNIKEGHSTRVTRVAGGPIDNPGLDMHVVRQSSEALAGVRITGTGYFTRADAVLGSRDGTVRYPVLPVTGDTDQQGLRCAWVRP